MFLIPGPTRKEPPKPRQLSMEELCSDYEPMDEKRMLEGGECYTVKSVDPVT